MITIHDCEQGTLEWFKARSGMPTASEFSTVMASGRGGGDSKTRRKYLLTLAGERLTGECVESYTNAHMERGKIMEAEARELYCFRKECDVERVGFVTNHDWRAGASPDALIGEDGMLEIKTKLPHLQLEALIANVLPPEHKAQCQGALAVSGRSWIDFVSYWPRLPALIVRVERDEPYIAGMKNAVQEFNAELDALVERFS